VKTQSEYEAMIIIPEQGFKILGVMPQPERTLTLLIAATGLRISECRGLQWTDVDYDSQQISARRSWTGGKLGKPKSAACKAPVPLVPMLAGFIREWQQQTPYGKPTDWYLRASGLRESNPASRICW
jgi:integrase